MKSNKVKRKIVIDAGAHIGQSIDRLRAKFKNDNIEIYSFEPHPRCFLAAKTRENETTKVFNKAVWIEDGVIEFYCDSLDINTPREYPGEGSTIFEVKTKERPRIVVTARNGNEILRNLIDTRDVIENQIGQVVVTKVNIDTDSKINTLGEIKRILVQQFDSLIDRVQKGLQDGPIRIGPHISRHQFNSKSKIIAKSIDFSKWIKENFDKEDFIYLKMDIEGAEYQVLRKMIDDDSISFINELDVEFHWEAIQLPKKEHDEVLNILSSYDLLLTIHE